MSGLKSSLSLHEAPLDVEYRSSTHPEDSGDNRTTIENGQRALLNTIFEDFNAKKKGMEGAQRAILNILEDFAAENTQLEAAQRAVLNMLEDLARSNEELAQFASVASHDLQEPLRKIIAFGDRLATHSRGALDEQGRDYLVRMENAARRMEQLIESLLELSRITTKGRMLEPVDLNKILSEALSDLEARIQQTGGRVDAGPLPTVMADRAQMRQLLQNLIGNALKFHKENVPPVVRIRSQRGESGGWQIHVTDNGIGFEEKYVERIFRPFQRLHGKNVFDGSGIGLAICQKIVARHSGHITADSQPGIGSDFVVTLLAGPKAKEAKA